jgi:hypothetical protein
MEQAIGTIKSEQQRADNPAIGLKVFPVAKPPMTQSAVRYRFFFCMPSRLPA